MGKYKELASNTTIFAISNIVSKLILSLLLPLYTRVLTTAEYGTAELLTTVSSLVIPVFSIAIQDSMFRYGLKDQNTAKKALSNAMRIEIIASILLCVFSCCLRFYSPLSEYGVMFFGISVLTMFRSTLSLFSKTINKTKVFALDNVLYNLLLALLNIFFLCVLRFGLNGYFLAIIFANLLSVVFLGAKTSSVRIIKFYAVDKDLLREMVRYSAPLIINSISWGLTHVVDKVMLASLQDVSSTGIYSAASKIPSLLSLVTGVFSQAWSISAIKAIDNKDDSSFNSNIFQLYHVFLIITSVFILSINNNLMILILGNDFKEAVTYIPMLLIGAVFLAYSNYYSPIFAGLKKSNIIMASALGGAILNCILNYIMIPRYGIFGACFATMMSYIFIGFYRMIMCQRYNPIELNLVKLIPSLILFMFQSVVIYLKKDNLIINIVFLVIIIIIYFKSIVLWWKKLVEILNKRRNTNR